MILLQQLSIKRLLNSKTFCIAVMTLSCAGNENIHLMTYDKPRLLRISLTDWEGKYRFAEYSHFKVESEKNDYKLSSVGKYTGDAGQ